MRYVCFIIYLFLSSFSYFLLFSCQGTRWCRVGKKNLIHDEQPSTITGIIWAKDVDYLPKLADDSWTGDVGLYSHLGGMSYMPISFISLFLIKHICSTRQIVDIVKEKTQCGLLILCHAHCRWVDVSCYTVILWLSISLTSMK